jgi:hypothetical protein
LDLVSQLFVAILVKVSNVTSKPYLVIEFAGVLNCFDRVVITGTLPEICHAEADLKIEFTANHKAFRKEERIKAIIAERGEHPDLVHIFSAMEPCTSSQPWHDKSTPQTYLKPVLESVSILFLDEDLQLFLTLGRGEGAISGFRAADLRAHIRSLSTSRSSYLLKQLPPHGLIKKVGHRYKYYLTQFARRVLAATLKLRE